MFQINKTIRVYFLTLIVALTVVPLSFESNAANDPSRAVDPRGPAEKTTNNPGDAEFNTALSYIKTKDFKDQNFEKALEYFHAAAKLGHSDSMYQLHLIYRNKVNINARPFYDLTKAKNWLDKAAEAGSHEAQYKLGNIYEKGIGVPKDLKKAELFYRQAAKNGNWQAADSLKRIEHVRAYEEFKVSGAGILKRRHTAMTELFCATLGAPANHPIYEKCASYSYQCLKHKDAETKFNDAYECLSSPLREIVYHQKRSQKPLTEDQLKREFLALVEFLASYQSDKNAEAIFRQY